MPIEFFAEQNSKNQPATMNKYEGKKKMTTTTRFNKSKARKKNENEKKKWIWKIGKAKSRKRIASVEEKVWDRHESERKN